jgi:hypothetical protein
LLEEIRVTVRKRKGSEVDAPETDSPPPLSACDRVSSWLCKPAIKTAIDIGRLGADSDDLDSMEAKLQAMIQEFNVSPRVSFQPSQPSRSVMFCQLTTMMRNEIKLDGLSELAGRILEHTSALTSEVVQSNGEPPQSSQLCD